jgi:GMP synthase-like glutamine amidotransferase
MSGGRSVLVLQHAACEPPGTYGDELDARGFDLHVADLDRGDRVPSHDGFSAVIAMGGPMGANDEAEYPWLVDEKRLIRNFVTAGGPFWGVCLGAQLLASSLDARVYEGGSEVGVLPVRIMEPGRRDPVFSALGATVQTLQWHSDTFDLPAGSVLLASSPACRNQAFRWRHAYGLQFHLEASPELVRRWGDLPAYAQALEGAMGRDGAARLLDALSSEAMVMRVNATEIFRRWLDQFVVAESE